MHHAPTSGRTLAWTDVATLLRQRHHRLTPQRRAVVSALAEFEGHVTAAQLIERCVLRDPAFVPSTVYRTLDLLEDLGLITHIHSADGHEEFQPAAAVPHAHLICRECSGTSELAQDDLGDLLADLDRRRGFQVDLSHLAIFGICRDCARR
jgi:Fur family ferric uptake transcriptional regulator